MQNSENSEHSKPIALDCALGDRVVYGELLPDDQLKIEFAKLRSKLGDTSKWTVAESSTYFGFFCHGWYGRVGTASYQFNP